MGNIVLAGRSADEPRAIAFELVDARPLALDALADGAPDGTPVTYRHTVTDPVQSTLVAYLEHRASVVSRLIADALRTGRMTGLPAAKAEVESLKAWSRWAVLAVGRSEAQIVDGMAIMGLAEKAQADEVAEREHDAACERIAKGSVADEAV